MNANSAYLFRQQSLCSMEPGEFEYRYGQAAANDWGRPLPGVREDRQEWIAGSVTAGGMVAVPFAVGFVAREALIGAAARLVLLTGI